MASFIPYRDGPGIARENPRRVTWTESQANARRYDLWLRAVEVGLYDPTCDCPRPHSPEELAALWLMNPRTVRDGIKRARRRRVALGGSRDAR